MPAYSFKERFVPMLLDGSKNQTIRGRREKGYSKPGDTIYLYYGMRTKWCRKLGERNCSDVRTILITKEGNVLLFKDRLASIPRSRMILYKKRHWLLNETERNQLAWLDGFRPDGSNENKTDGCFDVMLRWWKQTNSLPFIGDIIYWTKERSCRECGCTDRNCLVCINRTGRPCHWVEENLCSACSENSISSQNNKSIIMATKKVVRSSSTGKFVSKKVGKSNPAGTQTESVRTSYPAAWKAYQKSMVFSQSINELKSKGIQEKYAKNILEEAFAAGYRA